MLKTSPLLNHTISIDTETWDSRRVLVIAEAGTGHGGSLSKAKELIDAAATAGAGCVKFQMVYADEILHPNTGTVPLPGGNIRLYDRFRELELPLEFFAELKAWTESRGLLFLCTPFGLRSARELKALGVMAMKIASPELNFVQLVEEVASYGLPTLLSSGVSRLSDIELALETARKYLDDAQLLLMHCVTSYPAPEADYNLRVLESLEHCLGVAVGVSDHSLDPVLVPSLAVVSGAIAIEKHICLSRRDPGLDDPIALDPADFARMVSAIHAAEQAGPERTIRELKGTAGNDRIEAILGTGIKRLAASEQANYERTNRSVHALKEIQEGELFTEKNTGCLRTEKVLRPGLVPALWPRILGRKAGRFIPSGEGITFDDL